MRTLFSRIGVKKLENLNQTQRESSIDLIPLIHSVCFQSHTAVKPYPYLIPLDIESDPLRLRGVWQPQMRGPVLAGELGPDLRSILPGLGGGDESYRPRGEGIAASGGRDSTW